MVRQDKNKRLYNMLLSHKVDDGEIIEAKYEIP